MVRVKPFIWGAMLIGVWLLCASDIAPERYDGWAPYFMKRSELEKSVFRADSPAEIENPGKIWVAGDKIYIVERYKGVHIIDNSNPQNPRNSGFIVAPGCMDVAIKGDIIYLDNAVDLVAFDMAAGVVTKRLKNYFKEEPASPSGDRYYSHSSDMVLVGWRKTKTEEGRP